MKFLFLTDEGPGNAWLIREVEQAVGIQTILCPDWSSAPPPKPVVEGARSRWLRSPFTPALRRVRRHYFARLDSRNGHRLEKLLFPSPPLPAPKCPVVSFPWWTVNGEAIQTKIQALAPDLMFVCGAPLLKPSIFNLPRLGTVNLHFGISPDYRGQHTLLWPLLQGDYGRIGATLHYVNEGIDAGRVLFRIYPALEPGDDLVSIEAKVVRLAARTVRDFLQFLEKRGATDPLPGRQFAEKGQLIRQGDRTLRHDLRLRLGSLAGRRPPRMPERVELFYREGC